MNGWLTIRTRLLTGDVKSGLKNLAKMVLQAKEGALDMVRTFGKLVVIIGVIVGLIKIFKGGLQTLLARNEELANKIEYIKLAVSNLVQGIFTAVANLIEPIVTRIVNLIYDALGYLNVITKQFFGIDLFAKRTDKSLKSSSKSAKEMKKTLAGFDELNILNDTSSSGGGGGGGASNQLEPPDNAKYEKAIKDWIKDYEEMMKITRKEAKETFLGAYGMSGYFQLGLFDMEKGLVKFGVGFGELFSGLVKIIKGFVNGDLGLVKEGFTKLGNGIVKIVTGSAQFVLGIFETIKGALYKLGELIGQAIQSKINTLKNYISAAVTYIKSLFSSMGSSIGTAIGAGLKSVINSVITWITNKINSFIKDINKAISIINKLPGVSVKSLSTISLPKLARGGIVNNPGMGVNMGSYIAGEKGAEAVIPLTDNTLQRLANMIPITIDLTNTIDGRVLNRRLETIRNNNTFARNGVM